MSTTVAVHVPAWKKVGLKLKSAGDDSVDKNGVGEKGGTLEVSGVKNKDAVKENVGGDEKEREKDGNGSKEGKDDKEERVKRKKERKEKEKGDKGKEEDKDKSVKKDKKSKSSKSSKSSSASTSEPIPTAPTPTPIAVPPTPTPTAAKPSSPKSQKSLLRTPSSLRKSKSVTFTSDTKATDGDSIKTLYQNHDPFAHYDSYQQHVANYPTNELPAGFDDPVPAKKGAEVKYKFEPTGKRKKFDDDDEGGVSLASAATNGKGKEEKGAEKSSAKEKAAKADASTSEPDRKKHKKAAKPAPTPTKKSAAPTDNKAQLSYLSTYHTHRDAWRFEKAKQNWILRHAFDSSLIPDSHSDALKAYIAGLQGANARDRLLEAANEVVKRGADTISKDGEKLDAEDQKVGVVRAKLILAALGHGDDDDDDDEEEEEEEDGSGSNSNSSDSDSSEN